MRIAVWKTGHFIADRVAESLLSLPNSHLFDTKDLTRKVIKDHNLHIGYGILRGMENVFNYCNLDKRPWFNVDRGYWSPNHFDGNYRISLNGTQPTNINLETYVPVSTRRMELKIFPWKGIDTRKSILVCPPTDYAIKFFNINTDKWINDVKRLVQETGIRSTIVRPKGTERDLQEDLDKSGLVVTLNSAVGWEAMRQGIPVISDQKISLIGSLCKDMSAQQASLFQRDARAKIFAIMADMQMSLKDMEDGKLWPLMQQLMSL